MTCAGAPALLRRALAGLPAAARVSGQVALRGDAGYFAIGARRTAKAMRRLLSCIAEDDWHDATDMHAAQVADSGYGPD